MALNPLGAVQLNDFGQPRVLTGFAREAVSGGQYVTGSTATDVVSSGASSFLSEDLKFSVAGSGTAVNGLALKTVASGAAFPLAVEGVFIMPCNGAVTAGANVAAEGSNAVATSATAGQSIGRALTAGASGGFAVVHLQF